MHGHRVLFGEALEVDAGPVPVDLGVGAVNDDLGDFNANKIEERFVPLPAKGQGFFNVEGVFAPHIEEHPVGIDGEIASCRRFFAC